MWINNLFHINTQPKQINAVLKLILHHLFSLTKQYLFLGKPRIYYIFTTNLGVVTRITPIQLPHSIQCDTFNQSKPLTKCHDSSYSYMVLKTFKCLAHLFYIYSSILYFVECTTVQNNMSCTKHKIRRQWLIKSEKSKQV